LNFLTVYVYFVA